MTQENGATLPFSPTGSGGYAPPAWAAASLVRRGDGSYLFTRRHGGASVTFSAAGQLLSIADRDGETTVLSYNGAGQLSTVTDPAGRALAVAYGANGKIASVTDPAGRVVGFGYDAAGQLTSVTDVAGGVTSFGYDTGHRLTSMTDPRGGVLTNAYDATGRVSSQTDPRGKTTRFSYSAGTTTITDPLGHVAQEHFSALVPVAITRGYGTSAAATWKYGYDPATLAPTSAIDPDGHTTTIAYDADGDRTSTTDPLGRTATASYNGLDEPTALTDPAGVTTTLTYDAAGNLTSTSRPLTGTSPARSATTSYAHADAAHPGDVTSLSDPDGKVWSFGYDAAGDLTRAADPLGDQHVRLRLDRPADERGQPARQRRQREPGHLHHHLRLRRPR